MYKLAAGFIGFSEGIIVGSAIVAFITLLDIIPRLTQLTETQGYIKVYERTMILSAMIVSLASFCNLHLFGPKLLAGLSGLFMGVFIGLMAAALAEVTNVIPVAASRFQLEGHMGYILAAIVCGKVFGSLIYWILLNR